MDRAEYLDLFVRMDDQTHREFPENFLYYSAERKFLALVKDIEQTLGESCTTEYHADIQDASFHAQLFIPESCKLENDVVSLRVSNFGSLATLYDADEVVKPGCADKIKDALKRHEYLYIPSWILREPYGDRKNIGIPNWGVRYFDWLWGEPMTRRIDISPNAKAKLDAEAARNGQKPEDYLQAAVEGLLLSDAEAAEIDAGWDSLTALIERCQVNTGITDLAHQHDHYLHGTPKRED